MRRILIPVLLLMGLALPALAQNEAGGAAYSVAEQTELRAPADPPATVFKESEFPSAVQCAECHQKIFWRWASSNHAYASINPMFHKFEQRINDLASGTINYFCVRCHQRIGTQLGEPREQPLWERSQIAREGITCVTCHRAAQQFGKVNGERRITRGSIYEPMKGANTAPGLETVLSDPDRCGVSTSPDESGSPIHLSAIKFDQISKSEFCVSCHQVAAHSGIKLEVVWEQYRASPAAEHGIICHDCHMGKVQGRPDGYETWPVAIVNGRPAGDPERRHSIQAFHEPGYPIAHPGIFPFNPRALKWSITEWLRFDWRAGWGTPAWEDRLASSQESADFPEMWKRRQERETARYVIDQNLRLLELKRRDRIAVMENGSRLDGPFFDDGHSRVGRDLDFRFRVVNTDEGRNRGCPEDC